MTTASAAATGLPRARSADPVRAGQRVRNLFSGETMTFLRTSSETMGELIELELGLRPLGAPGGAPHRHVVTERFAITGGVAAVWIGGQRPRIARAGDVVEVPAGRWHFVVSLTRVRALVTIKPGMRFDELLAAWAQVGSGDLRPQTLRRVVPLLREHGCL